MHLRLPSLAALFFLVPLGLWADEDRREIVVSGEGRVAVEPDMAVLSLGVTREARLAKDALDDTSLEVAKVLDVLKSAGIAARDVQTSSVSLSPRWDRPQNNTLPRVVGYVASNTLSIRVRDLTKLGALMDQVVGSGANQMNGLSFTLAEPRPFEDEAREIAVKDALSKARLLARAAEVELGPVRRISEGGGPVAMSGAMRAEAFAADVPISAGEIDVQVSVTVTFDIAN